jgi:hypothetical protein
MMLKAKVRNKLNESTKSDPLSYEKKPRQHKETIESQNKIDNVNLKMITKMDIDPPDLYYDSSDLEEHFKDISLKGEIKQDYNQGTPNNNDKMIKESTIAISKPNPDKDSGELEEIKANQDEDNIAKKWQYDNILGHKTGKNGKIYLKIKWKGYEKPTWEPIKTIWEDDPDSVIEYARKMNLLRNPKWKMLEKITQARTAIQQYLHQRKGVNVGNDEDTNCANQGELQVELLPTTY